MKRLISLFSLIGLALLVTIGGVAAISSSAAGGKEFEVTITNLTRGQQFTPILVASHEEGVRLFDLGDAASAALVTLAETGDTVPLTDLLEGDSRVNEVETVGPLLGPGESRTITIEGGGKFKHISVAAMLIPTNDGFLALNGVKALTGETRTFRSPVYDAGSEVNDELCASIPGPFFDECGGAGGGGAPGGGEGYVHIHGGMHGIGEMNVSERDWRNPVAKITISRAE